ncbi:MAG: hypothetical protein HYT87_01710 [Nitrospirae bacterium]|nr:hypothetical protein [Nitrospirota bacterium]
MGEKKFLTGFLAVGLAFAGCGAQEDTKTSGSGSVSGASGIGVSASDVGFDLPKSISSQSQVRGAPERATTLTAAQKAAVKEIFGAIRLYVGIGAQFRDLIKDIVGNVPTNLPDNWSGPIENGKFNLTVQKSTKTGLTHKLTLDPLPADGSRIIVLEFDNVGRKKGIITLNLNRMDPSLPKEGRVRLTFDASNEADKQMVIEASGLLEKQDPLDDWKMDAIKLDARKQGSIILLSGNSHHPYAGADDKWFGQAARNYVFVARIDEAADRATVKLAVPTDGVKTDANFFTTYGVGAVFTDAVYSYAKNAPKAEMDFAAIAALLQTTGKLKEGVPTSNAVMTKAQFLDILRVVGEVDPNNKEVANISFVMALDNPVFFDASGYVSNGSTTPTGYSAPADLDKLAIIEPTEVRDLKVDF